MSDMEKDKKVLVVDDEELILELVREIFKVSDLKVETALDGRKAIEIFKDAWDREEPFDLVLLDMNLPEDLDGVGTLLEIRKIDPDIKAVVSSGYAIDDVISNALDLGFDAAVAKPYSVSVLRGTVNKLLGK